MMAAARATTLNGVRLNSVKVPTLPRLLRSAGRRKFLDAASSDDSRSSSRIQDGEIGVLIWLERLFVDQGRGVGNSLEAFDWNRFAGYLAEPISAGVDPAQRPGDLLQRFPIKVVGVGLV